MSQRNEKRAVGMGAALAVFALWACGGDDDSKSQAGSGNPNTDRTGAASAPTDQTTSPRYVLGTVTIDAEGNRMTYLQAIPSLEAGPFTNKPAIESGGNGTFLAGNKSVYLGLGEEPTWVRYTLDEAGQLRESGRMSLLATGATQIDYGNALVDAETAVSVLSAQRTAVVWNPSTMEIKGEIDLGIPEHDGYELEVWTTTTHNGLVYIPNRWSDWKGDRIHPGVALTILDPKAMKVMATAEDDRCASGGMPVFDEAGYAYVMGDGRTYSSHMFAAAVGAPPPKDNCILRIAPGATDFDPNYYHAVPALTGGLQSITELGTARQGTGIGFVKMFDPAQLAPGVKPVDFDFWDMPAHRLWRIKLADPPVAEAVDGLTYSAVGFTPIALNNRYYTGESVNGGSVTDVYEVDPATNKAVKRFSHDGYFVGLFDLSR